MGTSIIQRSFGAGEVSPAVFGRADQVKVQTGLRTCRNFFVRRHGGVSNRSGLQYIGPQSYHTMKGRIWKFVFNAEQTYLLLFENLSLKIVRNGAFLTVSGVAAYNGATAYVPGDLASSGGVNYYCIANTTGNAPPNVTYWYAMPIDGTYEIPTPYVYTDLPTLHFSQSGDVITITHASYAIRDLARSAHTTWTLTPVTMAPSIAAPGSLAVSGAAGTVAYWVATAIKQDTLEESLPSAEVGASAAPSSGAPRTLTIGAVAGAQEYNVYRHDGSGIFGFVGVSAGPTFIDTGIIPDYNLTPPAARDPFTGANNYPAVNGYLSQRKCYGGMLNDPETVEASRTGQFKNFSVSSPKQDDDAASWTPASNQVNTIRHILEVGEWFILTAGAEWLVQGNGNGALPAGTPGLKAQSYHGSSEVQPVIISNNLLFIQARGTIVRDLKFEANSNGYSGRDLTVFSPDLFDKYTLIHWDYAQIPHSIVWAVRSDGVLLGLTYLREHELWGWHRHDTDGYFEDVCVIPEGNEDAVYVLVKRSINGIDQRYLERFSTRQVTDIRIDATFMDSFLTYDGRNTSGTTMSLTGGTNWTHDEELLLTPSAPYFVAGDVGKTIVLSYDVPRYDPENGWLADTESVTLEIVTYNSASDVRVTPTTTVPIAFRAVTITDWAKGVTNVTGLDHLEGKIVSIIADGNVITNGLDDPSIQVVGGTLDTALERAATVIHIGLPYCSDFQTLDLEVLGGETLSDKKKSVNNVTLLVEASRGIWAGEPEEDGTMDPDHLFEQQQRVPEDEYDVIEGVTGKVEISISSKWNVGGRVFVRQRDPLPVSILASVPSVTLGG